MGDFSSQRVKKILKSFFEKKHGPALPTQGDERRLTPILAHTSEEPVGLHIDNLIAHATLQEFPYNYLLTLIKRNKTLHATMRTFLINDDGEEISFAIDERAFYETERDQVIDFISSPCRFFDLKNTHKRIIMFKNFKTITESQFEEVIKQWRKAPPTSP